MIQDVSLKSVRERNRPQEAWNMRSFSSKHIITMKTKIQARDTVQLLGTLPTMFQILHSISSTMKKKETKMEYSQDTAKVLK